MKIALSILGVVVVLGAGVGAYLYSDAPTPDNQPQYSEAKRAAMAARAAKQAEADIIEERMIEAISDAKSAAGNADLQDAQNAQN